KKAEAGRLTLILVRAIGDAFVERAVDRAAIAAFLKSEGAA
ncbi:MAG: 3-dehydroquinate synthase, partial [Phenylobacterium sp.]|nr:3-dehydroquinate synthase [Phenylobacterium sp.]